MQLFAKKMWADLNNVFRTPIENSRNCLIRVRNSYFFTNGLGIDLSFCKVAAPELHYARTSIWVYDRPFSRFCTIFRKSRKSISNRPDLKSRPPPIEFSTAATLSYASRNRFEDKITFAKIFVARAFQFALRVSPGGNQVHGLPPDSILKIDVKSMRSDVTRRANSIVSASNSRAPCS